MQVEPRQPANTISARAEIRVLAVLALPILGTQVAQTGMGFIDTLMSGRVGASDLAAVAIGSSLWVPVYLFISGVILATTTQVARLHGQQRHAAIGPLTRQAIWLALALGIGGALALRSLEPLLRLMAVDERILPLVLTYLDGVSLGMPAIAVFQALRFYSEALSRTRPVMLISFAALACNVPLNYVFIYGKLGLPALGGAGCGWATGCIMWSMLLAMCAYVRWHPVTRPHAVLGRLEAPARAQLLSLLRIGLPIGTAIFVEVSIFAAIALLLGPLGPTTVAAHQIALNFASMVFMLPLSVGLALTIRTGQLLGAGDHVAARHASLTGLGLNLAIAASLAALMLGLPAQVARLYTAEAEIIRQAAQLIMLAAVFQASDAIQIAGAGALRGYRDTKVPMYITLFAYWVVALPLGYVVGLSSLLGGPHGAPGLWAGLIVGLSIAAIFFCRRLLRISDPENAKTLCFSDT